MTTDTKPQLAADLFAPLAQRRTGRGDLIALILLCILLSAVRWCTLNGLWGDSPRWVFEAYRAASGEVVYRDFAWQYPPLSLLLCAGVLHLFGSTFGSLQLLLDVVSAAVVLLTWDLARRFLPKPLPLLTAAAMACAGASNTSNFALFSLQVYTPAILVGLIGLLIVLRETFDYLQGGLLNSRRMIWLSIGVTIGILSKPEFMLGFVGCLGALALSDLRLRFRERPLAAWLRQYLALFLACFLPGVIGYAVFAALCGPRNLLAGVAGYGQMTFSCPWWPTGLGVFGAVVALGYGVIDAALLSLTRLRQFRSRYGSRYWLLWAAAAVSVLLGILYLPFCSVLPVFDGHVTVANTLKYMLSAGTVLLPAMWFSIVFGMVLAVRLFRSWKTKAAFSVDDAILLSLFSAGALISLRGLFNGIMTELPVVTPTAYPIWFVIGPYFLMRVLERAERHPGGFKRSSVPFPVTAVISVFLVLRVLNVFASEVRSPAAKISTPSGVIRVRDLSNSPQVYAFIQSHAAPHEPVLDIAGGGGINMADRRPSPVFSTQFTNLAPSSQLLALDDKLLRANPPRIVIANAGVNFNASYGICLNTGCTFPALVWRSHRPACNPSASFPALDYIRENYRAEATFGDKIIYFRRGS